MVRLLPELLAQPDGWISEQLDNPSRPMPSDVCSRAKMTRRSRKQVWTPFVAIVANVAAPPAENHNPQD